MARAVEGRVHGLVQLAGLPVAERPHRREPGRQPRLGRDRRLGALEQVKVLAAAGRVARQQQVGGQRQQPVGGVRQQRGVDRAEVQRRRQRRVAQEVGHDPVLHQGQRPVGLPRRQEVAGRAPRVTGGLEPFGRPQLQRLLAGRVPGPQLGAQHLAHQMVVPEAGPLVIERTRNRLAASMRRSSAAASCRPVTAAHASAVSSPRTEVSSMNRATSGGC